ncbi:MAG: TIM barrel protein [Pirellulales bacterium]
MSTRRDWLKSATVLGSGVALAAFAGGTASADDAASKLVNHRIKQSVCHWCFNPMSVAELAAAAAKIGLKSVELIEPKDWPTLKEHGLTCAIAGSHGFAKGFAHKDEWDFCYDKLKKSIDASADFGCPTVITFSGFRRGMDFDEATKNMIDGLKGIVGYAEEKKITLCLEMLNSRVPVEMKGHPDYFCDHIDHSVEIVKKVGSPRLTVLFDIYHVQIMDGDVISRIRQHKDHIGHYHTAGNPGRNEIDRDQEINYAPIMEEIVKTGYKGFVGQEFIPTAKDKIASLVAAAKLCDV